ncbi:ABC transporter permease [Miltoncostaea marina]|uniref:ABC transporter permease n=1 Tax=Miltoncostaea marina TaxID=2843215 RepID=UPI001C3D0B4C|nr:ABC transporter permease [Miltoncostaea marina]
MAGPAHEPDLRTLSIRGTLALSGRETLRVLRLWSQTLMPPVVTAVLFLAIFGGALGDRLRQVEGLSYLAFILPGLLVMTVAGQAFANASTSLFQAKNEGYLDDILSSPLRPAEIALSYMAGGLVRGWLAAAAVAAVALPFADAGVHRPAVAVLTLALTGVIFSALGVITGLSADSFDHLSFVANLVIAPLALVGGVFYSVERLSEPWATLTRIDPIYYLVDATRSGLAGAQETTIAASLPVAAAAAALATLAAIVLLARGWRLKP